MLDKTGKRVRKEISWSLDLNKHSVEIRIIQITLRSFSGKGSLSHNAGKSLIKRKKTIVGRRNLQRVIVTFPCYKLA